MVTKLLFYQLLNSQIRRVACDTSATTHSNRYSILFRCVSSDNDTIEEIENNTDNTLRLESPEQPARNHFAESRDNLMRVNRDRTVRKFLTGQWAVDALMKT